MILQSLCEYYERKSDELPATGFEEKPIPYIIVIDHQGNFIHIEDNRVEVDGKLTPRMMRVPKASGRSGAKSYETAYCLWDHYGYIVAQPKVDKPDAVPTKKSIEDANKQHQTFKALVGSLADALVDDDGVQAVKRFLASNSQIEKVKASDEWQNCLKIKGCNLSFRLGGESHLVCQSILVIEWVKNQSLPEADTKQGVCLVTGETTKVVRLHPSISGVAQKPAPLASINDSAYCSFGKDKGFNFPVSALSAFRYTTALNHLLRKSSPTKFRIADTSYVCWASKENQLESDVPFFLSDMGDNPDDGTDRIKHLFSTICNGAYTPEDGSDRFYVLGLAPNSARIVIRFWHVGTVKEFSLHISQWFRDLEIGGVEKFGYPTIKRLLRASVLQGKEENIPPNISANLVRAILTGRPLPETYVQGVIRRIKAEKGEVSYARACAIKAYLNRFDCKEQTKNEEMTVSLNEQDERIGYRLGRLFAALEKLQKDALPGVKATIRERYYSSASCTPQAVFGTLLRMSNHHMSKLSEESWKINAERRLQEILESIHDFPSHLTLAEQGQFAIGYYHQKQNFYVKKSDQGEGE